MIISRTKGTNIEIGDTLPDKRNFYEKFRKCSRWDFVSIVKMPSFRGKYTELSGSFCSLCIQITLASCSVFTSSNSSCKVGVH